MKIIGFLSAIAQLLYFFPYIKDDQKGEKLSRGHASLLVKSLAMHVFSLEEKNI